MGLVAFRGSLSSGFEVFCGSVRGHFEASGLVLAFRAVDPGSRTTSNWDLGTQEISTLPPFKATTRRSRAEL